jgi:hypothetical protein
LLVGNKTYNVVLSYKIKKKGCDIMEKTTKKVYEPSENLKTIVKAIGVERKATIENLKTRTQKTSNCLIATASATNNKTYIVYHSKQKVQQIDGTIKEESAFIELTEKGFELYENLQDKKENN